MENCLTRHGTYLALNRSKLIEVASEEVHLALLSFDITGLHNSIVLLASVVKRYLELNHLCKRSAILGLVIRVASSPSHIGLADPSSKLSSWCRSQTTA